MNSNPLVSIILPVYNGHDYLVASITSIIDQTYTHFELIIINDASSDDSLTIIEEIDDNRIRLINNENNLGLIKTLNKGLALSNGKYIARMDQDDISLKNRIQEQVNYMETHRDIGISGTYIARFIDNQHIRIAKVPTNPAIIKCKLLFKNCLAHPSTIIRKDVLETNNLSYNQKHTAAEDYGLWQKASFHTNISNLPKVLLKYRENPLGMSAIADDKKNKSKRANIYKIIYKQGLIHLGLNPTEDELALHLLCSSNNALNLSKLKKIEVYLLKLKRLNMNNKVYEVFYFNSLLNSIWFKSCMNCQDLKIKKIFVYLKSELSNNGNPFLFRSL